MYLLNLKIQEKPSASRSLDTFRNCSKNSCRKKKSQSGCDLSRLIKLVRLDMSACALITGQIYYCMRTKVPDNFFLPHDQE